PRPPKQGGALPEFILPMATTPVAKAAVQPAKTNPQSAILESDTIGAAARDSKAPATKVEPAGNPRPAPLPDDGFAALAKNMAKNPVPTASVPSSGGLTPVPDFPLAGGPATKSSPANKSASGQQAGSGREPAVSFPGRDPIVNSASGNV